jgi:hypothetical protein
VSRGLGRVERAILDVLAEVPGTRMSTKTLVALVFGTAPPGPFIPHGATTAQVASVARAVRSLERKGLVVTSPSNAAHRRRQVRGFGDQVSDVAGAYRPSSRTTVSSSRPPTSVP